MNPDDKGVWVSYRAREFQNLIFRKERCRTGCQGVIQCVGVLIQGDRIPNLICARHVVEEGVNEASQDNLKFTRLL